MGFDSRRWKLWMRLSLAVGLWGSLAPASRGQGKPPGTMEHLPHGYVCERAKQPIKIDGKLDDADWKSARWTEAFNDIEGDRLPKPRFKTRAKMLWDDEYFYVAAQLDEPHVWGTLTKHDSVIFQDNDFEIFIDPDGDNQEYYELEINVLNTEWDLFLKRAYRNGGPAINEWEVPGLKTAIHVEGTVNDPKDTDKFWSVEWAIPWKVLAEYAHRPTPPKEGDQWRVNFSRVEWKHEVVDGKYKKLPGPEANWVWSPQWAIDMHRPEHWGYVQFATGKPGTTKFKSDPAAPVRQRLIQIYTAQHQFNGKNKKWATTEKELNLPEPASPLPNHTLDLKSVGKGFEAAITFKSDGKPRTLTIREDSRLLDSNLPPRK